MSLGKWNISKGNDTVWCKNFKMVVVLEGLSRVYSKSYFNSSGCFVAAIFVVFLENSRALVAKWISEVLLKNQNTIKMIDNSLQSHLEMEVTN